MEKKEEVGNHEESELSRRQFLKFLGAGAFCMMIPKTVHESVQKVLTPEEEEEWKQRKAQELQEQREQYVQEVLNRKYEYNDDEDSFEVPVRDSIRLENDSLVYTLPYPLEDLTTIPNRETEKNKRDSRKYYPIPSFYFYQGGGARFDQRYLQGENNRARPEYETRVPLIEEKEFDLPEDLSEALESLGLNQQEIQEKQNMILAQFSKKGQGTMHVYLDGKLLFNTRIAGKLYKGTTMGVYPEILPYEPWKKSYTYDNFPMPYAIHYGERGEFIHAGNTRGYSHGCTRTEAIKSALLWRLVMEKKDSENENEKFGFVALRDDQTGEDIEVKDTSWEWVGYKSDFIEKITPQKESE